MAMGNASSLPTAAQAAGLVGLFITLCSLIFGCALLPSHRLELLLKSFSKLEDEHKRFQEARNILSETLKAHAKHHLTQCATHRFDQLQIRVRKHEEDVCAANWFLRDYLQLLSCRWFAIWQTNCDIWLFRHQLVRHQNEKFSEPDRCFGDRSGKCCTGGPSAARETPLSTEPGSPSLLSRTFRLFQRSRSGPSILPGPGGQSIPHDLSTSTNDHSARDTTRSSMTATEVPSANTEMIPATQDNSVPDPNEEQRGETPAAGGKSGHVTLPAPNHLPKNLGPRGPPQTVSPIGRKPTQFIPRRHSPASA